MVYNNMNKRLLKRIHSLEEQKKALEKEMKMDKKYFFTQDELQLLYETCISYGDNLSEMINSIPNEENNELSEIVKDSYNLAEKITKYMEG